MLVVFEGIDGSGKETQIRLALAALSKAGKKAAVIKYPTRHYAMLNDFLEKKVSIEPKALFLLFLADIAEDQKSVKKALSENDVVILDRYVFSTISYEVNSIDYSRGKGIVTSVGYAVPDKVILLDIDSATSQARKKKQKELDRYEENAAYLERVRANFLKLAEERFLTPNWHKVDATKSIDGVHAEVMRALH
ncbi:MAG TPA: dTMP kinase [Candidatus Bilamarchaeum sp.]|nr:dTMP kinase [Candidatus Bilamarchaeum sp.]